MKIAMLVPSLANSGPVIVARDIIDELYRDFEFEVFYFKDDDGLTFPVPTRKISIHDGGALEGFDILHAHELRADIYSFRWARVLEKQGLKSMSTMHAYISIALKYNYGLAASLVFTPLWQRSLRRKDRLVTLSKSMADYYASRGIDQSRIVTINNGRDAPSDLVGLDKEDLDLMTRLRSRYQIIGGVGRLNTVKGFDQVIYALARQDSWAFVLIGIGPEEQRLLALAKELGVSDRFHLLGYRGNVDAFYQLFDVYAMVSHHEGLPLVLIEAAMHGVPSVCSRLPTMTEFFNKSEVVYYEPGDIDAMIGAIEFSLANKELLGSSIRAKYMRQYTRRKMAHSYADVYGDLCQ